MAGGLHPALAARLPLLGRRAAAWLPRLLAPVLRSSWPDVAWRWSRLTPTWFPVELGVSTAGDTVRYALEVTAPETPMPRRLAEAVRFLVGLDPALAHALTPTRDCPVRRLLPTLLAWHATAPDLRWAVWLGVRHRDGEDRFKLYVEVPPDRRRDAVGLALRLTGLEELPGAPVMVGLDLDGDRQEWYVEPGPVTRERALQVVGPEAVDVADLLAGGAWRPRRPAFSVAVAPGAAPLTTLVLGPRELGGPYADPAHWLDLTGRGGPAWPHGRDLLAGAERVSVLSVTGRTLTLGCCPA